LRRVPRPAAMTIALNVLGPPCGGRLTIARH
jgi:hypothetical protein